MSVRDCKFLLLMAILIAGSVAFVHASPPVGNDQVLRIWSRHPAAHWLEAFPIGNGRVGAMIYGRVHHDTIQFNEDSLWKGGPGEWSGYQNGNHPGGATHIKAIQNAIRREQAATFKRLRATPGGLNLYFSGNPNFRGDQTLSPFVRHAISRYLTGNFRAFGCYQAFGNVEIGFHDAPGKATDYSRSLNLKTAIAAVRFKMGHTLYRRTYFCSYPDQVMVSHFTTRGPGRITMRLQLVSAHKKATEIALGNKLILSGKLASNGMGYQAVLEVRIHGGTQRVVGNAIEVAKAARVTLLLTAATSYLDSYPTYTGNHYRAFNARVLAKAGRKSYAELLADHEHDYQSLFNRVTLDLGNSTNTAMTTRQRQVAFAKGATDPELAALIFQFGRYLMISSSRPGGLPANLQGIWNNSNAPAWTCDFHMDINNEMNYWPAETTNLSQCAKPLVAFVNALRKPGHVTAEMFYGAGGWTCHTTVNAFGYTAPGGAVIWGLVPAAGAWICQPVWEHYAYTLDQHYLATRAYPILKGAAEFWVDHLTTTNTGTLVSSPAVSPELGPAAAGNAFDQELVWDLFTHCIKASRILHVDKRFREKLIAMRSRLAKLRINKAGSLQEWRENIVPTPPKSPDRSLAALVGLYPGSEISPRATPKLAAAAKVYLDWRCMGAPWGMGGWAVAWRACCWAALDHGNRAYAMLCSQIKPVSDGGWFCPNLFDSCSGWGVSPPFEIDGNFGATAAITAMLLQSQTGIIQLLPALPKAWPVGHVVGLVAKGAVLVDESWSHGKATAVTLTPRFDRLIRLLPPPGQKLNVVTISGHKPCHFSTLPNGVVTLQVHAEQTYTLKFTR